jgi:hypothetical protein
MTHSNRFVDRVDVIVRCVPVAALGWLVGWLAVICTLREISSIDDRERDVGISGVEPANRRTPFPIKVNGTVFALGCALGTRLFSTCTTVGGLCGGWWELDRCQRCPAIGLASWLSVVGLCELPCTSEGARGVHFLVFVLRAEIVPSHGGRTDRVNQCGVFFEGPEEAIRISTLATSTESSYTSPYIHIPYRYNLEYI